MVWFIGTFVLVELLLCKSVLIFWRFDFLLAVVKGVEYPRCAHYVRKSSLIMSPDPVSSRRILVLIISTFLHFKHDQMGLIHHTAQPFLEQQWIMRIHSHYCSLCCCFFIGTVQRNAQIHIWVCVTV